MSEEGQVRFWLNAMSVMGIALAFLAGVTRDPLYLLLAAIIAVGRIGLGIAEVQSR